MVLTHRKDIIPFRISPMLATLVDWAFHKPNWIYEEKYDGISILAYPIRKPAVSGCFLETTRTGQKTFPIS